MHHDEPAVRPLARDDAGVDLKERFEHAGLGERAVAGVLDRDDLKARPQVCGELGTAHVHLAGDQQRVLEHSPADALLQP